MNAIATESAMLAQHSNESADWGSPILIRRFAACVLKPVGITAAIDLDYSSGAYWQRHWPDDTRPTAYLNGAKGRDILIEVDRRRAVKTATCGSGFLNPAGLGGGEHVQKSWEIFDKDHASGWLGSGIWLGFSIEQFSSLQGVSVRNPLSEGITTIVPSRRCRFMLHPDQYIALLKKKLARREKGSPQWKAETRQIAELKARKSDEPVTPSAPPHSSYLAILWARDRSVRRRQMDAARQFLEAQKADPRSLLQEVAIVGGLTP